MIEADSIFLKTDSVTEALRIYFKAQKVNLEAKLQEPFLI